MPERTDVAYIYDETFDGLLTAVFEAYARRPAPVAIVGCDSCQQQMGVSYTEIATDEEKARRVIAGVQRRLGESGYEKIWTAFLSENVNRGDIIYRYIQFGIEVGTLIHRKITDQRVIDIDKLCALVTRQAGLLIEFVRFSRLEGGIYYGEISPDYAILPLIMPHFASRFHVQPFLIHDKTHGQTGVYDRRDWYITDESPENLPAYAADEVQWRRLWKTFYDTVAIKERINPALRRQHMPKKYWKHMIELQPELPLPDTPLPGREPFAFLP